jgi:hypothetical protein
MHKCIGCFCSYAVISVIIRNDGELKEVFGEMTCQLALWALRKSKPLALPTAYLAPVSGRGCRREDGFFLLSARELPFSGVSNYPQNPLDFSPLSTYFINTYPAVLRVSYRVSGAALQNT